MSKLSAHVRTRVQKTMPLKEFFLLFGNHGQVDVPYYWSLEFMSPSVFGHTSPSSWQMYRAASSNLSQPSEGLRQGDPGSLSVACVMPPSLV